MNWNIRLVVEFDWGRVGVVNSAFRDQLQDSHLVGLQIGDILGAAGGRDLLQGGGLSNVSGECGTVDEHFIRRRMSQEPPAFVDASQKLSTVEVHWPYQIISHPYKLRTGSS